MNSRVGSGGTGLIKILGGGCAAVQLKTLTLTMEANNQKNVWTVFSGPICKRGPHLEAGRNQRSEELFVRNVNTISAYIIKSVVFRYGTI